jgi:hypothetical protein
MQCSETTDNGTFLPHTHARTRAHAQFRRSYDRSLSAHQHHHHHHNEHPTHPTHPSHNYYASANEARHRSANYAWERRHRPPSGSNPHAHTAAQRRAHDAAHHAAAGPSSPYYHRPPPRTGWKETELDRVNRVSGLGRAVQLIGLFIAVAIVGTLGKS